MDTNYSIFYFLLLIFEISVAGENQNNTFVVVSTSQRPSELDDVKDRLSRLELHAEIHQILNSINASFLNNLEKTKLEIIKEVRSGLELQLKEIIKQQMLETKNEIIAELKNQTLENFSKQLSHLNVKFNKELNSTRNSKIEQNDFDETEEQGTYAEDCKQVQNKGNQNSGAYRIRPKISRSNFLAFCDMSSRGGGWTSILHRFDGSQNFYLNWTEYKDGFGNLSGEFFLGLQHLYTLTHNRRNDLLFELVDWDGKKVHAIYDDFEIGSESQGYYIKILGNYSGDAGDSFRIHSGQKFSTADRDQEDNPLYNCAKYFGGAWWYNSMHCYETHLTGRYVTNPIPENYYSGAIHWFEFHQYEYSLKEVKMMIRAK